MPKPSVYRKIKARRRAAVALGIAHAASPEERLAALEGCEEALRDLLEHFSSEKQLEELRQNHRLPHYAQGDLFG